MLFTVLVLSLALLATEVMGGRIATAANASFADKQDFATGSGPRSAAAGDLNGDGKLDLITVNVNTNTVSTLLNTTVTGATTASFSAKQDFAAGRGPVSVAVGDLNGDGKLDLAVANFNSNTVSVLLNTTDSGAATFTFTKADFATAQGPIFLATADLNGDGKLDLAVVNLLLDSVSALLNSTAPGAATPTFEAHKDFATGGQPVSATAGDVNGDGKLDLAVTNSLFNTVSVLLNTTVSGATTPSFGPAEEFATGDDPQSVSLSDVNSDGKRDLVVANFGDNSLSVLINTTAPGSANASFAANQEFATGVGPVSVTVKDLNGDGRVDLAVTNFLAHTVSVLLNTTVPGAATANFAAKQDSITGTSPIAVVASELNGDGLLDLAVANINSSSVSVLLNSTVLGPATPGFAAHQDFETVNPRFVTTGDLNGDGRLDLVVANVNSNTVSVLLNTTAPGAATSSFAASRDFATGVAPISVAVGDLNRDGKLDVAVANRNSNTVSVLLNTTTPGSVTPNFAAKQDLVGESPFSVALGDLNGDGRLDLVVANVVATVSVVLNTTPSGVANVSFATKQDFAIGDHPLSVAVGDLNGDGKVDLAVVDFDSNSASVLLNITEPGAAKPSFSPIHAFPTGAGPLAVTLGEVNGDGKLDLAVVNLDSNNVSVLLNTTAPGAGAPSFATKQDFSTGTNQRSVTVGDLNGDGKLEVAVARTDGKVTVLLNTTADAAIPSFERQEDFASGFGSVSVASADLNGDGKLDLATANVTSNTVSVLLNSPTIVTTTGLSLQEGLVPTHSQIANVTNYGGDGSLNITVTSDNPANGVTISNIVNTDGNVTADIVASCGATRASFTLQASDGSSSVSETLNINVTANTAPTLNYLNQTVALSGSLTINPANGPADNGRLSSIVVQSSGTFTGNIIVNDTTGVVSIRNTTPAGTHTITIRATDNCGATTDASFTLTVGKAAQTIIFDPLSNKTVGDPDFAVSATATSGLPVSFVTSGQCTVSGNIVHIIGTGLCTITASQAGDSNFNPSPNVEQSFSITNSTVVNLGQSNYNVSESMGLVTITVNRTGDLSFPISVQYATVDTGSVDCSTLNSGSASSRCDFGLTLGKLVFGPTEAQKTFIIPITQDSYTEGPEMFSVILAKSDATLGEPSSATVTITDGTTPLPPNASDDTEAFVRQQYRDFLNREADPDGLAFWIAEINNCTPKPQCTVIKRVNASAAFFLSIEFQLTGNLVRNFYVAALDRPTTNNMPTFEEFERDTQAMQRGVIVDPTNNAWETVLNNNRDLFVRDFVTRAEFIGLYPTTDTPTQYVDKLNIHAGITPSADERAHALAEFGNAATAEDAGARGRALLDITQNTTFQEREVNRSFVQMQYFGYLRRNPNDAPDRDFEGFNFWLGKLTQFNGNFQDAEMVQSFLVSDEYRRRFGP